MDPEKIAFALYGDMECTRLLPRESKDGKTTWVVDFGRIDAGHEKTGQFYVKNIGNSLIDEVEVNVEPSKDKDVEVSLLSQNISPRMEPGDIFPVTIKWTVDILSDAKRSEGYVTIKGMRLEEGYRPPHPQDIRRGG